MTLLPTVSPLLCAVALLAVGGCAKPQDQATISNQAAQPPTIETVEDSDSLGNMGSDAPMAPTQQWVGRWTGPEGLFLDIQPSPNGKAGHYALTNKDTLDRQGDYAGIADGATIRFVRDGKDMAIRPGTGDETGFKYLAGKTDCLIVVPGQEGYCR